MVFNIESPPTKLQCNSPEEWFFSHLEVQNVLKIYTKIVPLNIFKNIFSHLKFKLKILKKIQNLRADVLKHFVLYND